MIMGENVNASCMKRGVWCLSLAANQCTTTLRPSFPCAAYEGGHVPYNQVLLASLDESDKLRLYSLSIDASTGALTLPSSDQEQSPSGINAKSSGTAFAAPLCTSRDESHVFVVYPADNVGFRVFVRYGGGTRS